MKKLIAILAVVLGVTGLVSGKSFAEEAVKAENKICPVTGEAIGEGSMAGMTSTVEYKGKIYNLCCEMCKDGFLKDPEKAIKSLEKAK